MSASEFFTQIDAFDDFSEIANIDNYVTAPDDWHVVISDVAGSTRAVAEGRYKEVNMIGAACINAVLNITASGEIPYVFGGDGATLLVPADRLPDCKKALLAVRRLAESNFNLSLRVGVVPVATIHRLAPARVLVGKYRLSPGNELAAFSGGGIEQAERWIKSDPAHLVEASADDGPPDLNGLSCRWEPLKSQNGVMISLLLKAGSDDEQGQEQLYRGLIGDIDRITGSSANGGKPISDANMKFRWPPRGLAAEIRATAGRRNRMLFGFHLYFSSLIQWFLDRFDLTAGGYSGGQYRVELRRNTDYRRFDDTLRMLLDCNLEQADEIETLLEAHAREDGLIYGVHRSDSALMTCLVFNLDRGEHIHFIDGSDGGFTSAAKNMKAKLKPDR
jgi:hypothetical protein